MEICKIKNFQYKAAETVAVVLPLFLLLFLALNEEKGSAGISCLVLFAAIVPFFADFEHNRPRPRDMVPIAVMGTIAALGRALFAAIPSFNPTSAVVIITGISLGPQAGFLSGALAALASNMLLGQGPWTPWQMYAWGMTGFIGALLFKTGLLKNTLWLYGYGFTSGILFGWFMNLQYLIGYVRPIHIGTLISTFAASSAMDVSHGISTVLFLFFLKKTWCRKLDRLKRKYGIGKNLEERKENAKYE